MINKNKFQCNLYEKIAKAMEICEDNNVIDMRLYKDNEHCGIYSIFEVDDLYNAIKDYNKEWFIDFYENIKDANSAEFIGVSLFSDELNEYIYVRGFEEKYKNADRDKMTFEEELEFIEDAFNMYETSGFSDTYHSRYDDEKVHNGKRFKVTGRASYANNDCDFEQLPMWHIEFEDGTMYMAFPEEICKIEEKNVNVAQELQVVETEPIKENSMSKINNIIKEFNTEFGKKTFNEILGCAKCNIYGLSLVKDVDEYNNNEIACEVRYFFNEDYNRENSVIIECKLVNGVVEFSYTQNKIIRFGRVWELLLVFDETETIPTSTEYKWYELLKIDEGTFYINNYDGEMVFVSKDDDYLLKCNI